MNGCRTCESPEIDKHEKLGKACLEGRMYWREAAKQLGYSHHAGFKNHMEKHYDSGPSSKERAKTALEELTGPATDELIQIAMMAPPELKPLYAVAIKNLVELADTKPSQQHLIIALKSIAEITGMNLEQRVMLQFAKNAFAGEMSPPEPRGELAPVSVSSVIDVDVDDEDEDF